MDAKFINSYFYSFDKENKLIPTPQTLLLKKLVQLKNSGDESFYFNEMWTLYRDDEPSSLFNGIFVLIENIAKCNPLWKSNLLEFTNITERPYRLSGSVGSFGRATPKYPSGYVKITEKGKTFVSILEQYEKTGDTTDICNFDLDESAFDEISQMFSGILY